MPLDELMGYFDFLTKWKRSAFVADAISSFGDDLLAFASKEVAGVPTLVTTITEGKPHEVAQLELTLPTESQSYTDAILNEAGMRRIEERNTELLDDFQPEIVRFSEKLGRIVAGEKHVSSI